MGTRSFDLLVIGGGITGAGVAREAALRGLSVALVERGDFAQGTSSRSTKLIHGGLRYLKNLDFRLVREAVQERMLLAGMAPHLVKVRQFVFPVYRGDPDPLWKLRLGLVLYDLFAGKGNPVPHRILGPEELMGMEPILWLEGLVGGGVYCDCATDDARLTLEVLQSATGHGAVVQNYAGVTRFCYEQSQTIAGACVRDVLTGEEAEVRAARVLAAAGPWADQIRRLDDPGAEVLLRLTKGVHLTIPQAVLPISNPVVMRGPDGRLMFAIPAGEFSYVGTTDTDHDGAPEATAVEWEDVAYILAAVRRSFPGCRVSPDQVTSAWVGLRPLIRPTGRLSPSQTSRDYALQRSASGLVTVIGGKLTAFRAMASHIVDEIFPATQGRDHLAKSTAPLPGSGGHRFSPEALAALAVRTGASAVEVQRLADRYGAAFSGVAEELTDGGPAELVWLRAQLRHAVRREMARRLEDLLARRTGALLFSRDNGRPYVGALAAEMGEMLGWAPERVREEERRVYALMDAMFAWKKVAGVPVRD